ncbi:MAG: TerD family protein, partial [Streptomyces sp.]|nr:TerD family protein [Streptomyces sp.]
APTATSEVSAPLPPEQPVNRQPAYGYPPEPTQQPAAAAAAQPAYGYPQPVSPPAYDPPQPQPTAAPAPAYGYPSAAPAPDPDFTLPPQGPQFIGR